MAAMRSARASQCAATLAGLVLALSVACGDAAAAPSAAAAPGPHANDVSALTDDEAARLYADLERHLRWEPSDARALVFKARLDMRARRYARAAATYEKAVAGNSKAARDPGVWVEYAEARGMAQGRTLAGEPLKLVQKALAIDGNHPQALDLAGSAAWEMREFRQAAAYWHQLLKQLRPGTPRHAELARAVERAEQRARVSLPPPAPLAAK